MPVTSVGRLLLDEALPPALRGTYAKLDKKGQQALFDALAEQGSDEYRRASKRLLDAAREVAYLTGGYTFGLADLEATPASRRIREQITQKVEAIAARRDLTTEQRNAAVVKILQEAQKPAADEIYREALEAGNPLAGQVQSGSRGNATQLKGLLAGDFLYEDHKGRPIPVPALSSYSEGLTPPEYWAAAYGARKGVRDVKMATAESGYLAKQLAQVSHRLIVTRVDSDEQPDGAPRGLPVETGDPDNEGALLATAVGGFPRNTLLTPRILRQLKEMGHDRILVRSPVVGGPPEGGVYARDVGMRERGGMAPVGDYVGLAAAQALAEKMTQGALSSKHSGGVAGAARAVSGFKLVDALVQAPKVFPGAATHAQKDGQVGRIEDAPQGGMYIHVDGERHYLPPGATPKVKTGEKVEAGDVLSDGIPHPAEVVRHKGVGEGRRYLVQAFRSAYRDSGLTAHRRNVELLVRGLADHVRFTGEHDAFMPEDVVPYSLVESQWEPRDDAEELAPSAAVGRFLEVPALHYSIGTPIRPSVAKELEAFGVHSVRVHRKPPPFEAEFVRGMANLQYDPDWMTRHLGSNLKKTTLEAAHRGRLSDPEGTSYVPAAAERATFGQHGLTRSWSPDGIRDGDGDGTIHDGTPKERPAPRRAGILESLGLSGRDRS